MHFQAILFLYSISFSSALSKTYEQATLFDHGFGIKTKRPLNIAHRGASGVLPEHTVAAYERAIEDGADVIECDICITKDLKLVCRHESMIGHSTNVASVPKFANRTKRYFFKGENRTDWFTVDFLLEELLELKAIQIFDFRDQSFNGNFTIATFDEFVQVAKNAKRPIVIYPEIKNPDFVNAVPGLFPNGTRFEDIIIQELTKHGYTRKDDGCLIQSFDEESLIYLKENIMTEIPLVMCLWYKVELSYIQKFSQKKFYGICAWKDQIYRSYIENSCKNYIYETTDFAEKCHALGLKLHLFTFRNEERYLAWDYEQDSRNEYKMYMRQNIDGYFTDFPATLNAYLDSVYDEAFCSTNGAVQSFQFTSLWVVSQYICLVFFIITQYTHFIC